MRELYWACIMSSIHVKKIQHGSTDISDMSFYVKLISIKNKRLMIFEKDNFE